MNCFSEHIDFYCGLQLSFKNLFLDCGFNVEGANENRTASFLRLLNCPYTASKSNFTATLSISFNLWGCSASCSFNQSFGMDTEWDIIKFLFIFSFMWTDEKLLKAVLRGDKGENFPLSYFVFVAVIGGY